MGVKNNLKIIFMGTPSFAVPALKKISEKHQVVLVVTREDKRKGRGKKLAKLEIKICAEALGLEVYQPEKINSKESIEKLKSMNADLIVVAAYGKILKDEILKLTGDNPVNIHASLLPKLRGAAPINRAIINGDEFAGVSIMKIEEGLDTGDYCFQDKTPIKNKNIDELTEELGQMGADLIIKFLEDYEKNNIKWIKQEDSKATYAPKIEKEEGFIDFKKMTADEIERLSRALFDKPGISFNYDGNRIKISDLEVLNMEGKAGQVISNEGQLIIMTKDKAIKINKIQWPGKKMMNTEDFLRGRNIEEEKIIGG